MYKWALNEAKQNYKNCTEVHKSLTTDWLKHLKASLVLVSMSKLDNGGGWRRFNDVGDGDDDGDDDDDDDDDDDGDDGDGDNKLSREKRSRTGPRPRSEKILESSFKVSSCLIISNQSNIREGHLDLLTTENDDDDDDDDYNENDDNNNNHNGNNNGDNDNNDDK